MTALAPTPSGVSPAGTGSSHEALLLRHGLITHVADVDETASAEDVGTFARDAARVARNVIALSERRFGLLLPAGAPDRLSAVPYTIHGPDGAPLERDAADHPADQGATSAEPKGPSAVRAAGETAMAGADPGGEGDAGTTAMPREAAAQSASDADPLLLVNPVTEPNGQDDNAAEIGDHPDAAQDEPATNAESVTKHPMQPAAAKDTGEPHDEGPTAALARPDTILDDSPEPGTAVPAPPEPAPLSAELDARLAALEARLDALSPDAIAARIEAGVVDAVDRRIETSLATRAPFGAGQDALEKSRALASGLEAMLARLGAQVDRVEATTGWADGPTIGDLTRAIVQMEESIATAFEAAGAMRDGNHRRLLDRVGEIAERPEPRMPDLAEAVGPLRETLEALAGALDARLERIEARPALQLPDLDTATAPLFTALDTLAFSLEERLGRIEARPDPEFPDLAGAVAPVVEAVVEAVDGRADEIRDRLEKLEDRPMPDPDAAVAPLRAALDALPEDLSARLEALGTALGERLSETARRTESAVKAAATDLRAALPADPPDLSDKLAGLDRSLRTRIETAVEAIRSDIDRATQAGAAPPDGLTPEILHEEMASLKASIAGRLETVEAAFAGQDDGALNAETLAIIVAELQTVQKLLLRQAPGLTGAAVRTEIEGALEAGMVPQIAALREAVQGDGRDDGEKPDHLEPLRAEIERAEAAITSRIEAIETLLADLPAAPPATGLEGEAGLAANALDVAGALTSLGDDLHVVQKLILRQAPGLTEETLRTELGTAAESIASRMAALETALAEKGGLLSDSVETAQKSMKRFWLAAEEALGRLDLGLTTLQERIDTTMEAGTAAPNDPGATLAPELEAIAERLDALRESAASPAMAELRLLLAELLAGQARALTGHDGA
ncbi:MAG: hypothetical protein AAFR47_09690 [Pseudomonadota bacterium]